ncbi:Uncharacterised protein [Burkholderia pseudomallei]|nr:Uncharacterised protein [Burkholderia pseudomallei]CAJ5201601.1 Uncharacterised protein [Burkholderia pseudomallei]CAJ7864640.1 Uncharacterised protein [Burkholderia pseudomallei]CAJ8693237.1 Uncharacterised protein [Burkholderia pseudomallei]
MTMSSVRTRVTNDHFGSADSVRLPHSLKPPSRMIVVTNALFSRFARHVSSPSRNSIGRLVPVIPTISLFDGDAQKPIAASVWQNMPAAYADAGASASTFAPVSQ